MNHHAVATPHALAGPGLGARAGATATCFFALALALALAIVLVRALCAAEGSPTIWVLDNLASVAGCATTVLGMPAVVTSPLGSALDFDGIDDGLIVATNPLEGCAQFTIEILICPAANGPEEQRFLHIEDEAGRRTLLETRSTRDGRWALDGFLFTRNEHKLELFDRTKLHAGGNTWTWVASCYDGRRFTTFVNGAKELEGDVVFASMIAGKVSLGVRLDRTSWFKGAIREVRFHRTALSNGALQRGP